MKLSIAQRLRPFCHLPGTSCVVPFSHWQVQIFPTLLRFQHLVTLEQQEYRIDWKGPISDFTAELDLERGVIWVYGHTAAGYRRLCIEMQREGIVLTLEKENHRHILPGERTSLLPPMERLALGIHKALDWELVRRRRDLREIFPLWLRLGQMVPAAGARVGAAALLHAVDKSEVISHYLKLFMVGFTGILAPRLVDRDYQGIIPNEQWTESPLILLTEGARLIRTLFFQEKEAQWSLLPCLPPEFHAGRFLHLHTEGGDHIDMEWSSKLLRQVKILPTQTREIFLKVQTALQSYRVRTSLKDKGIKHKADQSLAVIAGQTIFLDRFEK